MGAGVEVPRRWRRRRSHPDRPLRVAMIGQKGVPATFGGIEHHVEQLGQRLVRQGAEVTVYCRRSYADEIPAEHLGMRLVVTPTVASKHLDAIVHSVTSTLHAMLRGADVVHYHALGPGLAAPLSRFASRSKVVLTLHGLDHERAKWSGVAQRVLGVAYWLSGRVPDAVVAVSGALADRYREDFGRDATHIPNGVAMPVLGRPLGRLGAELGIEAGRYVLFVGRVVPEKRPDLLIDAARHLPPGVKAVIVGDSSFSDDYVQSIRASAGADDRVVLPGYLFGEDLAAIYENAAAFVQPSDLEGLPLTLLEALSYEIPVVASDIPPHVEVLRGCGCGGHRLFARGDSRSLATELVSALTMDRGARSLAADAHVLLEPYDWDRASTDLMALYTSLVSGASTVPRDPEGRRHRDRVTPRPPESAAR